VLGLQFLTRSKSGYTPKPEAARLYELGRWHYNQLTLEDHIKAHKYLTRAVEMDPKFVQPNGELIMLLAWDSLPGLDTEQERLRQASELARKVMAVQPRSAEAHTAVSYCHF